MDDDLAKYAVQPSMVPASIKVTSRQAMMIEALFGNSIFINDQLIDQFDEELKLFNDIMNDSNISQPKFVVSNKFMNKWKAYLFSDEQRFTNIINGDLCNDGSFDRF